MVSWELALRADGYADNTVKAYQKAVQSLADWLAEHLDLAWIQHPGVRQVLTRRLDAHARAEWTGAAGLLSDLANGCGKLFGGCSAGLHMTRRLLGSRCHLDREGAGAAGGDIEGRRTFR